MSAQRGRDLLVKIGDGGSPETFITVAGLRATTLSFNAQTVDVTNADSANQWRELLAGAGVKSANIRGQGIFKDADSDETVRGLFFAGALRDWQVIIPDFGTVTGPFQITALEIAGRHDADRLAAPAAERHVSWPRTHEHV